MMRKRRSRRFVAISLVVLGGALLYLAPQGWIGLALLVMGIVVELVGITLERKA